MQEVFEKIIERLEEEQKHSPCRNIKCRTCKYTATCYEGEQSNKVAIDNAIEIVNKLAEEYGKDTNVTTNGWIPCSERLPKERIYEDGYVEPSDTVLVFTKYGSYRVSRYWGNRRNKKDYYDWVDIKYQDDEVIAWQPLPAPYVQK